MRCTEENPKSRVYSRSLAFEHTPSKYVVFRTLLWFCEVLVVSVVQSLGSSPFFFHFGVWLDAMPHTYSIMQGLAKKILFEIWSSPAHAVTGDPPF